VCQGAEPGQIILYVLLSGFLYGWHWDMSVSIFPYCDGEGFTEGGGGVNIPFKMVACEIRLCELRGRNLLLYLPQPWYFAVWLN